MQAGLSERLIIQDFKACAKHLRKGILVNPSVSNVFQWQVTLMPNTGYFKDQLLTFAISFDNFPAEVPKIYFQPRVLHPMINPNTHIFDTSEMFKEWNVSNRAYTLINYIYDSFADISIPNHQNIPNPEAAALLRKNPELYAKKALEMLPPPPPPNESSEQNMPTRWNGQKERVARILASSDY